MANHRPSFVSLFAGCGGFDAGFLEAGYRCAGAFDIDALAVDVYRANLGPWAHVADLTEPLRHGKAFAGIDVLVAGPPCQGFSTVGARDPGDPRNRLLPRVAEIAAIMRPKVCVIENVPGVTAGVQARYWRQLSCRLRAAGYRIAELECKASAMGVPQHRKRLVMIAWRTGAEVLLELGIDHGGSLRNALKGISGNDLSHSRGLSADTVVGQIARRIKPGQKLSNVRQGPHSVHTWNVPEVFGHTTRIERSILNAILVLRRRNRLRKVGDADPILAADLARFLKHPVRAELADLKIKGYVRSIGKRFDLKHTFNGKCRRLCWDAPAPTVDTRFADPWYFLHPGQNRGFTIRETARIQGFSDSFTFFGPRRSQLRLIGNAVPPPMGRHLAVLVRNALLATGASG